LITKIQEKSNIEKETFLKKIFSFFSPHCSYFLEIKIQKNSSGDFFRHSDLVVVFQASQRSGYKGNKIFCYFFFPINFPKKMALFSFGLKIT